jgi:hypothetical protein
MEKIYFLCFYINRSNPALLKKGLAMTGTFWLTVDNSIPVTSEQLRQTDVQDPDGLFKTSLANSKAIGLSSLYLTSLDDLNLPHGSNTPDVFKQVSKLKLRRPDFGTALRILMQHPSTLITTRIDERRIESCLVGIKIIEAMRERKYVIELCRLYSRNCLNFRRADDDVRWPDYEYWVFEK